MTKPYRVARIVPDQRAVQARDDVLDEHAAVVYGHAVRHGTVSLAEAAGLELTGGELHAAIEKLVALRLLRRMGRSGDFAPLDPEIASASLISPLQAEIHQRQSAINTIRAQIEPLRPQFEAARRLGERPAIRVWPQTDSASSVWRLRQDRSRQEVVAVRARHVRCDGSADERLAADLSSLRRGVGVRVLYPHAARVDLATRAYIRQIAAAGAQVRTVDLLPRQYAVFDATDVLITDGTHTVEVSDKTLIQLLVDVFDTLWEGALAYQPEDAGYQEAADEMLKTIARLLAEGLTDVAVARRLGISLRSCRRHIASLLASLNSVSRFQAGVIAARSGLISGSET